MSADAVDYGSEHRASDELLAGLEHIQLSPADAGRVKLIVARPGEGERTLLETGELNTEVGLVGDMWHTRPSSRTPDGSPSSDAQLTLMNARAVAVIAGTPERWSLAGDQLYVDLDLSFENLPAGTQLAVGDAVVEVTPSPHTGCAKFRARFGTDALKFVNKSPGRELRLRGVNTRVVKGGSVRRGDEIRKL